MSPMASTERSWNTCGAAFHSRLWGAELPEEFAPSRISFNSPQGSAPVRSCCLGIATRLSVTLDLACRRLVYTCSVPGAFDVFLQTLNDFEKPSKQRKAERATPSPSTPSPSERTTEASGRDAPPETGPRPRRNVTATGRAGAQRTGAQRAATDPTGAGARPVRRRQSGAGSRSRG